MYSVNYLPFHLLKINRKDQHKVVFICSSIYFHIIVYTYQNVARMKLKELQLKKMRKRMENRFIYKLML